MAGRSPNHASSRRWTARGRVDSIHMTSLTSVTVVELDYRSRSQHRHAIDRPGYHHLGLAPKHYRRSKTGRMLSDYPELDFRAEDNSGVHSHEVPAGTEDTGVFRCRRCGRRFDAIIANRVRLRKNGRRGDLCAGCSGWMPAPGNSLNDLPQWLLCQLRLPAGADPRALPIKGGTQRRYWWECPRGHLFVERVGNRLRSHASCNTEAAHICGCPFCRGRRPAPDNNLGTAYPHVAQCLDRAAFANGYRATDLPARGGRNKHLLSCGVPGHSLYRTTVAHALASPWLGCPDCRAETGTKNRVSSVS